VVPPGSPPKKRDPAQGWPHAERRRTIRRAEDRVHEQALRERDRKLNSLVELGQLIGLDLKIDSMLLQIAQKATEVMNADRCSLFLYDPKTDELWSTVALGMEGKVIRIPSGAGMAGYCFKTGETVNLENAYTDPHFNRDVDARTGYRTRSLLCMPMYKRSGGILGVIQLLNKKNGLFTKEDETFLMTFGTHASVFIEMAQLQTSRFEALEHSREELRRLGRAKDKALHHLSHELKTPLAVVQGTLRILKRKIQNEGSNTSLKEIFDTLERHLGRLLDIQQEAFEILRAHQELEEFSLHEEIDRIWVQLKSVLGVPTDLIEEWNRLKTNIAQYLSAKPPALVAVSLYPVVEKALSEVREKSKHRDIRFFLEGRKDILILTEPTIPAKVLEGLLKNAVENTPDEGMIGIVLEQVGHRGLLKVQDFGIGITEEDQKYVFDGLFITQDTDLYSSKKPYDFNAGGKGLDLLRIKVYGQRFGFDISMESRRCIYAPTNRDDCPGKISHCDRCKRIEDCLAAGGTTFCISFPLTAESTA
jgi:signal transduction histidine kinase